MIARQALIAFAAGLVALGFLAWTTARSEEAASDDEAALRPLPMVAAAPEDNPTTPEKVALGKQLFFDPRLSGDNSMSCATCHLPEKAFADGLALGRGRNDKALSRNTPSLLNIGFSGPLLWDGRAGSLEEQAITPITAPDEMNQDLTELERELNAIPGYVRQFRQVFGTAVDRRGIARALAAFQRTLVTGPSPLDRYLAGEEDALSPEAQRGLELFTGSAGCVQCHRGPLLSDGKFYRLGVSFRDDGRKSATGKPGDRARFRTPPLRNVSQTAPYMHDGSLKTLTDVVMFYYRGVPPSGPDGLPLDVEPLLGQSYIEIADLVAFLEALSGEPPKITPPELP